MRKIDAVELGGTLFVPATHKHLQAIARGEKFPTLRSAVFDTEDGIADSELDVGMEAVASMLETIGSEGAFRFIRPRNPETLRRLLMLPGIEKIDGFVLPKFGLENAERYLSLIQNSKSNMQHHIMPSIEGEELFDVAKLIRLRDILMPYKEQIVAVRFGAEDMLRQLGLRRDCSMSLYDMCAPSQVIANVLMTFKPYGFDVSAPVYRCYKDIEGFEAEVKRDLAEGLVSKTIIHPDQIGPLEQVYRVTSGEVAAAEALLGCDSAVFAQQGTMAEVKTQTRWAEYIISRKECYGEV